MYIQMSNILPEEPSMRRHKRRSVYLLLPIYHHKNIHQSAASWTHNGPHCPRRCYQMHHREPESGKTHRVVRYHLFI